MYLSSPKLPLNSCFLFKMVQLDSPDGDLQFNTFYEGPHHGNVVVGLNGK